MTMTAWVWWLAAAALQGRASALTAADIANDIPVFARYAMPACHISPAANAHDVVVSHSTFEGCLVFEIN